MAMHDPMSWIDRRLRLGWLLIAAGVIVAATGILVPIVVGALAFYERIIAGLGILLLGIGVGHLVRYSAARRDARAARRVIAEERDERTLILNARAGNRAYRISVALAYSGLMWASLTESGGLPPLSGDALWYFLAALVVLPFVVYVASLLYDQQHR